MKLTIVSTLVAATIAASAAAGVCPGTGDCFTEHESLGCDDASCCTAVCAFDSFCCEVSWDGICASEAANLCVPACPGKCEGDLTNDYQIDGADLGLLLANWTLAGCGDLNVDGEVDGADLGLLLSAWGFCPPACGVPTTGDCCTPHEGPFCNDEACCSIVCGIDVFCCDVSWTQSCADIAKNVCQGCVACGSDLAGDCCISHNGPFCNDETCCNAVCAIDGFCCNVTWDSICADEAQNLCQTCPACGNDFAGDCCVAHNGPFCNDEQCCVAVCSVDPFCCTTSWDGICADESADLCGLCFGCGTDTAGDCCVAHDNPFCADEECCTAVCAVDGFCCEVTWDEFCANAAADLCGQCFGCGTDSAGDCFAVHNNPFCNDEGCCDVVCANDTFCCSNTWDALCVGEAFEFCVTN